MIIATTSIVNDWNFGWCPVMEKTPLSMLTVRIVDVALNLNEENL